MPDRSLLSHEAFGEALDRYGHDLEHWPTRLRPLAESLLTNSDRARRMMAEAEFIAEALSKPVTVRANPDLMGRIMQQAGIAEQGPRLSPAASAEIIRPDWPSRRHVPVVVEEADDSVVAPEMAVMASRQLGGKQYWAAAAIVAVGLLLGWSSGPLTLQDNGGTGTGKTATGLASYLSL